MTTLVVRRTKPARVEPLACRPIFVGGFTRLFGDSLTNSWRSEPFQHLDCLHQMLDVRAYTEEKSGGITTIDKPAQEIQLEASHKAIYEGKPHYWSESVFDPKNRSCHRLPLHPSALPQRPDSDFGTVESPSMQCYSSRRSRRTGFFVFIAQQPEAVFGAELSKRRGVWKSRYIGSVTLNSFFLCSVKQASSIRCSVASLPCSLNGVWSGAQ